VELVHTSTDSRRHAYSSTSRDGIDFSKLSLSAGNFVETLWYIERTERPSRGDEWAGGGV
jgi:hypothetical protein